MGQTIEMVTVKNFGDILDVKKGLLKENQIRSEEVDAIVDTGAAYLSLSPNTIEKLGLLHTETLPVRTANGNVKRRIFAIAEITIQGRTIRMEVMENDATTPALIGYLILEAMDYVVCPQSRKIIPNPEHEGKWIMDLF